MSRISGTLGHSVLRPSDRILDDLATGTGRGHMLHQKLIENRDRNWLLALTLHSCAKFRMGVPRSRPESVILDALRDSGIGDARIREHGRLYASLDTGARDALFPEPLATLPATADVAFDEIAEWLPGLQEGILAQENAIVLDPPALQDGRFDTHPGVPSATLARFGSAVTVVLDPDRQPPATMKGLIKAERFKCHDETGWDLVGADAPYWIFGAVGGHGSPLATSRSRTFDDTDTGEMWRFAPDDGRIWGPGGLALELPDTLAITVSLWQHVAGAFEEVDAMTEGILAAACHYLSELRSADAPVAILSGANATIVWLLTFLNEDFIADHTFLFSRTVLEKAAEQTGDGACFKGRFTDGDGDYSLEISMRRSPWMIGGSP